MSPFKHSSQSKGQSLLEYSILLPFFISIIFAAVEYTNMFMVSLRASNLSRAISNVAFRDCGSLDSVSSSTCLYNNTQKVSTEGELTLKDFNSAGTVIASTYEKLNEGDTLKLIQKRFSGNSEFESRFSIENLDQDLVANNKRVVIGEIFYPYQPITPVGGFLNLLNMRTVIYEVTIY